MSESQEGSTSDASDGPRRFSFDDPPRFLNISDLRLELQTIDSLTSELSQIRKDFQEMLLENTSETRKITHELLPPEDDLQDLPEDTYALPEKKTVRQLLEDLTTELKTLRVEIKEIKIQTQTLEKDLSHVKRVQESGNVLKIPELPPPLLKIGNEIYSMSEEDLAILKEINLQKILLEEKVSPGKTLEGRSFSEFSMNIPKSHEATLAVEFTNYLKETLVNPVCWFTYGAEEKPLPFSIGGRSREAFGFHSMNLTCTSGIFSYEIGTLNLRLAIGFYVHSIGNTVLGVAMLPKEVSVNKDLEQYLWNLTDEKVGAKRCPGTSGGEVVLKLDDLRVRVALTRGPRARMRTEVLRVA